MMGKKKREVGRKTIKSDKKINQRNKSLMIDKILSYNPMLSEGIEVYKDANKNFMLLIFLGALLIDFPLISVPCCILSMFFIIKMLQFIRYKSINNIVKELAKDLSFKGIYDKEKVENMLDDFKFKYGESISEYKELVNMLEKYEALVTKIEYALKNVNLKGQKDTYEEEFIMTENRVPHLNKEDNVSCQEIKGNQYNGKKIDTYYRDFNEKLSALYRKEDGEIKRVNKAIEFFDTADDKSYNSPNSVVLKNTNKDDKKLTVYLYKKASILQRNAL